ncbi:hypothetical protein ABZS92_38215, partial [Streptomyces sp. NPDC005444]
IASAMAVLLLPYSLIGPFAGVLLDRWRRRQVPARVTAGPARPLSRRGAAEVTAPAQDQVSSARGNGVGGHRVR